MRTFSLTGTKGCIFLKIWGQAGSYRKIRVYLHVSSSVQAHKTPMATSRCMNLAFSTVSNAFKESTNE